MASDAAQNYYLNKQETGNAAQDALELTRMQGFLDGDDDIFDVLNKTKNTLLLGQQKNKKG